MPILLLVLRQLKSPAIVSSSTLRTCYKNPMGHDCLLKGQWYFNFKIESQSLKWDLEKKCWRFSIITFEICLLLIFKISCLLGNYCPRTIPFVKEEADILITRFLETCLGSWCLQRTYSPLPCLGSSTNNINSKE